MQVYSICKIVEGGQPIWGIWGRDWSEHCGKVRTGPIRVGIPEVSREGAHAGLPEYENDSQLVMSLCNSRQGASSFQGHSGIEASIIADSSYFNQEPRAGDVAQLRQVYGGESHRRSVAGECLT